MDLRQHLNAGGEGNGSDCFEAFCGSSVTSPVRLDLIQEIDRLWDPLYPYLAKQISELYGREDGEVVEMGPFCGVIVSLFKEGIGHSFTIASFPKGMGGFFRQELERKSLTGRIEIIETSPSLVGLKDAQFDLAVFRGAFFFPSLFQTDFSAIDRILKSGGMALLGGGFGKHTPVELIEKVRKRSHDLNLAIGKIEIDRDELLEDLRARDWKGRFEFLSEGGLWLLMRK